MTHAISPSRWHTRFEDDDDVSSTDHAVINHDDVASSLIDQGCNPLDFADVARRGGWTAQRLIHALRQGGYSKVDIARAVKHFGAACSHEGGGDIGTLPVYPDHRPTLVASDDDIVPVLKSTWDAIKVANNPRQFFDQGGQAVWIKASPASPAVIEPISPHRMRFLMGQVGEWVRRTDKGPRPSRPPTVVAEHLVADPHPPLPRLNRLVSTPVSDGRGNLAARAGFHPESGLFVATHNLKIHRVPHAPTATQVSLATSLIFELVENFPFVNESDRTNSVALLMLPFVRDLIDGPTPLHLVTKPTPGSGGTLLAQALLFPAIGRRIESQTMPDGESEVQRRITAALTPGPEAIAFDNICKPLDSAHLASVLTAETWRDRQIRTATILNLPVKNAWVATGNNVVVSQEIARRTIPIRLDPGSDRPWDRTDFRHKDLIAWVADNREELIWAALTLAQAWVAEGMPAGTLNVGMYESWSRVMSGICEVVGMPGLRDNWEEWFEERPSVENRNWNVVDMWNAMLGDTEVKAAELLPVIGPLLDIPADGSRSAATMLGSQLGKLNGTEIGGYRIVGREVSGSKSWRLTRLP